MKSYTLRKWASLNIMTARLYITLFHIYVSLLAIIAGCFYFEQLKDLPFVTIFVPLLLMATMQLYYKAIGKPRGTLAAHFGQVVMRFVFWALLSNLTLQYIDYQSNHSFENNRLSLSSSQNISADNENFHQKHVVFAHELKAAWQQQLKSGDPDFSADWAIVLFFLLTIVVLFVGLYLTAFISCSLACSSQEGLAIIVLFAGLSGTATGEIFIIRKIKNLFNRLKKERPEDY
jgi:hypothetical protein